MWYCGVLSLKGDPIPGIEKPLGLMSELWPLGADDHGCWFENKKLGLYTAD